MFLSRLEISQLVKLAYKRNIAVDFNSPSTIEKHCPFHNNSIQLNNTDHIEYINSISGCLWENYYLYFNTIQVQEFLAKNIEPKDSCSFVLLVYKGKMLNYA